MSHERNAGRSRAVLFANVIVSAAGLLLIAVTLATGRDWLDAHVLPTWRHSRLFQTTIFDIIRVTALLLGVCLIVLVRPAVARAVARGLSRPLLVQVFACVVAAIAGIAAAETVLRSNAWRSIYAAREPLEPLRRPDPYYGWLYVPDHVTKVRVGKRSIEYATSHDGYRVRSVGQPVDFRRPAIVFAGESILLGWSLPFEETIQAETERLLGVPVVNLSVNAFGTDQIYMRLKRELPRFERPAAVVILFMPRLLDRNLDRDRPHLDAHLRWHAGEAPSYRLAELGRRLLRYRSEDTIREGIATTQAALRGMLEHARRRGAEALIVVPQFEPADASEARVRRRVLDEAGLPYLLVPLDEHWRGSDDIHPDVRATKKIAAEIALRLANSSAMVRTGASVRGGP
jgi:hypothetical protein